MEWEYSQWDNFLNLIVPNILLGEMKQLKKNSSFPTEIVDTIPGVKYE